MKQVLEVQQEPGKQKSELAELIRGFEGRYRKAEFRMNGTGKDTCVMGAIFQECGWNTMLANDDINAVVMCKYPELRGHVSGLIDKNNSSPLVGWEELAQFVERGFKD